MSGKCCTTISNLFCVYPLCCCFRERLRFVFRMRKISGFCVLVFHGIYQKIKSFSLTRIERHLYLDILTNLDSFEMNFPVFYLMISGFVNLSIINLLHFTFSTVELLNTILFCFPLKNISFRNIHEIRTAVIENNNYSLLQQCC